MDGGVTGGSGRRLVRGRYGLGRRDGRRSRVLHGLAPVRGPGRRALFLGGHRGRGHRCRGGGLLDRLRVGQRGRVFLHGLRHRVRTVGRGRSVVLRRSRRGPGMVVALLLPGLLLAGAAVAALVARLPVARLGMPRPLGPGRLGPGLVVAPGLLALLRHRVTARALLEVTLEGLGVLRAEVARVVVAVAGVRARRGGARVPHRRVERRTAVHAVAAHVRCEGDGYRDAVAGEHARRMRGLGRRPGVCAGRAGRDRQQTRRGRRREHPLAQYLSAQYLSHGSFPVYRRCGRCGIEGGLGVHRRALRGHPEEVCPGGRTCLLSG